MLKLIYSGGQTGADVSGWRAALRAGLNTFGYMPRGYKTLDGPKPEYKTEFNAVALNSPEYKTRTYNNVREADATIRIAKKWNSLGEICTLKAIKLYNKPSLDIDFNSGDREAVAVDFILMHKIEKLNIAGNSCPGMEIWAEEFLYKVFMKCK
jgi:hypothetical protein